jgi:hypothetical protein
VPARAQASLICRFRWRDFCASLMMGRAPDALGPHIAFETCFSARSTPADSAIVQVFGRRHDEGHPHAQEAGVRKASRLPIVQCSKFGRCLGHTGRDANVAARAAEGVHAGKGRPAKIDATKVLHCGQCGCVPG